MAENQDTVETDSLLSSPAAFVEGGIQDACDDACSICLEEFSDSDPSTVTCCKHEFHLQCILEWCQRSSQCPMCWQPISLKDSTSQELLEAVEREREIRSNPPRHMAIFHHPTLGEFELQHLPVGGDDGALEERIIQHLAAAAAMGRTHHHGRREGHRRRPSSQSRPHLLVFSTHPHAGTVTSPVAESEAVGAAAASPSIPFTATTRIEPTRPRSVQADDIISSSLSGPSLFPANRQGFSSNNNRISLGHPSSPSQDRAGPSDLQSFSESLKSKWNAVSMRYKESISKSSRGWREKLFACNAATGDVRPEGRREEGGVSRGVEGSNVSVASVVPETNNRRNGGENQGKNPLVDGNASGSLSN